MKNQTYPSFDEEKIHWTQNKLVIGIDEVGRGAFAGPIVAAAVIFPPNFRIQADLFEVNDSKLLKPNLRKTLSDKIIEKCLFYSIAQVDVKTINKIGIGESNKKVFRKVVKDILSNVSIKLPSMKTYLLVDGFHIKFISGIGLENQKGIIKGDQKSFTIAAASILAKVYRDNLMKNYHSSYPNYSFAKNKGYGTKDHQIALKQFGICDIHRTSFNLGKFI